MDERPDTALYFTTVVALERDLAVMGGHLYSQGTEPSVTRFNTVNGGKWGHLADLEAIVYAIARKPGPPGVARPTVCAVGSRGLYWERVSKQKPVETQLERAGAGYFMDLRLIGGHLYACGGQNVVRRQTADGWVAMDQGIFSPLAGAVDRSLQSIDGFAEDDIYAAGYGGAIWHWDGERWSSLDSPTNYQLEAVLCASDGTVYIGGGNGQLFAGDREKGWKDLGDPTLTKQTINDLVEFRGRIYASTYRQLFSVSGGAMTAVEIPIPGKHAFIAMDAIGDEALWTVGDDWVLQFDGDAWKRHVIPDNG